MKISIKGLLFVFNVILLFAAASVFNAYSVDFCTDCDKSTGGLTCNINEQYIISNKFKATPLTFEAVFTVDKSELKEMNTISGSDGSFYPAVVFGVNKKGQPRMIIRDKTHFSKKYDYVFNDVDVATGKRIHMSIVADFTAKKLYCYVNGKIAQTLTNIASIKPFEDKYNMIIGGDYDKNNATFFVGEIEKVAMWSDVRTASEIASDYACGVNVSDKNMLVHYDFMKCDKCMVNDLSANENNLKHLVLWQDKKDVDVVNDFKYSFAVVGDTQKMCTANPEAMSSVYDWILDNKESQKIEYVIGLGDITDFSNDEEWSFSCGVIGKLNDKIPYTLVRGNHDDWDDFNRFLHNGYYEKTLDGLENSKDINLSDPVGQPGVLKKTSNGSVSYITRMGDVPEGGIVKGDLTNSYRCIKIKDADYIFITLDFAPDEDAVKWVDNVLAAFPDHKAIIVTHAYMFHDGTTIGLGDSTPPSEYNGYTNAQNGEDIWIKCLAKHENVLLVLSGHDPWQHIVYRQDIGQKGNTVTQMLINPQGLDEHLGATAMIAMLYFSETGEELTVRYYSVAKDCYGSELSQFTVHMNHTYKKVKEVQATCTAAGKKAYYKCSDCGLCYEDSAATKEITDVSKWGIISALGHTGGTANCKDKAVCTVCKKTYGNVNANNHKSVTVLKAVAATYKATGLTEGKKCTACGTVTVAQKKVARKTLKKVTGLKTKAVNLSSGTKTTLTLAWTKVADAQKYEVYQLNDKKWKKIGTTSKTTLIVKKLKSNKSYKFKVRAIRSDTKGAYSTVFTGKTVPLKTTLTLKAGKKALTASWKTVANITGYEVQASTSKKFTSKTTKKVSITKAKTTKTTIKKLSKGKKYYVKVRAYKTVGKTKIYSAWSSVKTVKVK